MLTESQFIRSRCLALIREAAQFEPGWRSTALDFLHPQIGDVFQLEAEEYPIVSFFAGPADWTVYTTHRVVASTEGIEAVIPRPELGRCDSSGFRQDFDSPTVTRAAVTHGPALAHLLYESGYAAAAPIHYFKFWSQKWPGWEKTWQIEMRSTTRPFPPLTGA